MNRFEHDVVSLGLINIHDVNKSIPVRDCEREELFAQLAVKLFEFNHNLALVNLHCALGF